MGRIEINMISPMGAIIGDGPVTEAVRFISTEPVNRIGSFEILLPAADPKVTLLLPQTRIEAWYTAEVADGVFDRQLAGDGIIKNRSLSVSAEGEALMTISGMGMGQELADDIVMMSLAGADGSGVLNAPALILEKFPGWSLDTSGRMTTETRFYGAFAGETGMEALIAIAEKLGENFIILPGRKVKWLGSNVTSSGIRATSGITPERLGEDPTVIAIESIQLDAVGDTVVTRIVPFGAGDGEARLKLNASTWTAPDGWVINQNTNEIINTTLEATIGKVKRALSFKDIAPVANTDADLRAASDQLAIATYAYMRKHAAEQRAYQVSVAGLQLGRVRPGETIRIDLDRYEDERKVISIHEELSVLSITKTFEEDGVFVPTLEVSNVTDWILTDNQVLASALREQVAAQAHPQLSANCWWMSFQPRMDKSNRGEITFWLTKEIVTVNEISLWFRILPLESSVKSVAGQSSTSGPSSKTTSDSGGGAAVTSGPSSKTTSDSGGGLTTNTYGLGGSYPITIPSLTVAGETDYGANINNHKHAAGSLYTVQKNIGGVPEHQHTVYVQPHSHGMDHTHNVSVPSHSHGMDHTHTMTPNVAMQYGLFRNSGANTLGIADLMIKVNGSMDLVANVIEAGSGWYRLDITAQCVNAIGRPGRENNSIVITTATDGKNGMIDAKLKVRSVIQAIAYL